MLLLNDLVKLTFLALAAKQFSLHHPDTWMQMWTYALQHHAELGWLGVGTAALLIVLRETIRPIVKVAGGLSAVLVVVGAVLAVQWNKTDLVMERATQLFDWAWTRYIAA